MCFTVQRKKQEEEEEEEEDEERIIGGRGEIKESDKEYYKKEIGG